MGKMILTSGNGMVLTDGNVYGKRVSLAINRDAKEFYEITEEKYLQIVEQMEEDISDSEALAILVGGTYDKK